MAIKESLSKKLFEISKELMLPKGRKSPYLLALTILPGLSLAFLSWVLKSSHKAKSHPFNPNGNRHHYENPVP